MPMTVTQMILLLLAIVAIVWGIVTLVGAFKKKKLEPTVDTELLNTTPTESTVNQQNGSNGLPVVPRHERSPVAHDQAFKAEITPDNPNGTIQLSAEHTELNYPASTSSAHQISQANQGSTYRNSSLGSEVEPDAFSMLADATENITPPVATYDENQLREPFTENSPIVDDHIQTQIDHDQNSPLNNAEQNISVFVFPDQRNARIAGRDLLQLFDVYGLKYGAMNMFHRYEGNDGTGILWFSVMMVGDEGVEPFDLNQLPTQAAHGLAFFLSLPHPKAPQGFDSMISIADLMAQALQASLYDENDQPITKDSVIQMRETAVNYS